MSPASSRTLRFGLFELDVAASELRREGIPVKLQPQPLKVLAFLAERAGEVVTREELRDRVWGDSTFVDFDRGLNFCVMQIRTALDDDADNPRFVQTVPRRGYRFIAGVQGNEAGAPVARLEASAPSAPPTAGATPGRSRRPLLAGAGAIAVAIAIAALLRRPVAEPSHPAPNRAMLAVLPFDNLSSDEKQAFFADGMTEELITQLGRIDPAGLGVIARTSVMRYRGGARDVATIGRELGVGYVLEGSVRKENERVRVTAQLIRVADQTHLWAESYDRAPHDALTVQEEIARRVAASLAVTLLDTKSPTPVTRDARAHEAYLEARALLSRRGVDELRRALTLLEEARGRDPGYAAAHAGAADAYYQLGMRGGSPAGDLFAKAREAALRAIALDDRSAEAHTTLGAIRLWQDWDPEGAFATLKRALSLNPSFAPAHHDMAWVMIARGNFDEAVASIRRAQEIDPLSPRATIDVGWVLLRARRYDEAAAQGRRTLELEPRSGEAVACLAEALHALGRLREVVELQRRLMTEAGASAADLKLLDDNDAGAALRRAGEWRLSRLRARAESGRASWHPIAIEEVQLGRTEAALSSLEKALDARESPMVVVDTVPAFDALKGEPRFRAIVEKVRAARLRAAREPSGH